MQASTALITPIHSPVALVAIDRNRWSSSTGNGGRLQPETLVAMDRRAHTSLVMERSTVQSCLAASVFPPKSTLLAKQIDHWMPHLGICTQNEA